MNFLKTLIISLFAFSGTLRGEVILQYFNTSWAEIEARMPELAEAGYDSLWLPPPFKAGAGAYSVGFDTFDRFDLGDIDQSGSLPTKYGTKGDLIRLMEVAHRFGIRVYFDNVMAHNAGYLNPATQPGELFPEVPGFVPEDFHIGWNGTGWQKFADWPDWNNEWEVLNRNPFAWDIANENGDNLSFYANGLLEGSTYGKRTLIRHPGMTDRYPDLGLSINNPQTDDTMHPFADKEPYQDFGIDGVAGNGDTGEGNGKFDFTDSNSNGQHDLGEASEPFTDTGIDPSVSWRQTAAFGFGDGIYNMGDPVEEDVNGMLYRAVRWFIDQASPDGFRLDAVKHVPDSFFGKQSGDDKDYVNWGYNGAIQEQFNLTRGYSDWNNHRDTVFNTEYQSRDDALLYGEHLGGPPGFEGYLNSGMRIATDTMLNAVKSSIGSNMSGMDAGGWGHYGGNAAQSMSYVMSHDNTHLFGGDRQQAHAWMLMKEGIPIVYTDGYHVAGEPDYFPKPSYIPFLGQNNDGYMPAVLNIHRDFARGYQVGKWNDPDFLSWERHDEREKKGGSWNSPTLLVMMARNYQGGFHSRAAITTSFPTGARLRNYSPDGGGFYAIVQGDGTIRDTSGNTVGVPSGGYYAFSWRVPEMPNVFDDGITGERQPIEIYQNGERAPFIAHKRTDGPDGDAAFNPYGLFDADSNDFSYERLIPRVTDGSNLSFLARADGTTDNILIRLDGGIDINSQMNIGPMTGDLRDFAPGRNDDQKDPDDSVNQSSIDTYLGYEQMSFTRRVSEKFAAKDTARNVIGSIGSESYELTVGTAGVTIGNGDGPNSSTNTATWIYHDPAGGNQQVSPTDQFSPAPQGAAGQDVTIWAKVGYEDSIDQLHLYYTIGGASFPEGSAGVGKGSTQVASFSFVADGEDDGTGQTTWWSATLPAQASGTVVRYKIGGHQNVASDRFPWSEQDITISKRMETVFEVTGFDATTADYHVHNDYGKKATGLEEGYHVLRTRSFVKRTDGSSIFKTNTQTFYYDAERPEGAVAFPREGDTIAGSGYGAVVYTAADVAEVWYRIVHNIEGTTDWERATLQGGSGSLLESGWAREWRFEYSEIPQTGTANIEVRLKEASSSDDNDLSDTDGWFTTLTRNVVTGSSTNWNIGIPGGPGEVWQEGWNMQFFFKKELLTAGLSDADFLKEVSVFIGSSVSGSAENEVLQNASRLSIQRDVNATEHAVLFNLPNLYNGNADFLHHVRATHQRGSVGISDTELIKAAPTSLADNDNDDLPDVWESQNGLQPTNPFGTHGGAGDYDGDGLTNLEEYLFGLSPRTLDSELAPGSSASLATNGDCEIRFDAIKGRNHQVEWSENLDDWFSLGGNLIVPSNAEVLVIDSGNGGDRAHPSTVPKRYYRVIYSVTF
ncbi:alpha-amylase family glycosyl hydrolase [Akkermansiaceae bacterium]|nr:alpha-amylase family glycosyl hydrolase [Akkermansiaceae bacterium]